VGYWALAPAAPLTDADACTLTLTRTLTCVATFAAAARSPATHIDFAPSCFTSAEPPPPSFIAVDAHALTEPPTSLAFALACSSCGRPTLRAFSTFAMRDASTTAFESTLTSSLGSVHFAFTLPSALALALHSAEPSTFAAPEQSPLQLPLHVPWH